MKRALWAAALLVVAAAVALVAVVLNADDQRGAGRVTAGSTSTCTAPWTSTSTTLSSTTSTTVPTATTSTSMRPPSTTTTAASPSVLALEQRLSALGYWLGPPDGVLDARTAHAVTAFQKLHGLKRDGVAGPAVLAALERATRPAPRSTSGHVIEIDLTHQVLLVADGGRATAVLDVSTGRVAGTTPVGHFKVTRQIDGYHRSPLGVLYRPKYFHEGVAVHGYPSVPPKPASHGCVRTTNPAMDWLWASGVMPVGTPVWVYR